MHDGNPLAYLALALFFPLAFAVTKRRRPSIAATGLFVGAILFLPEMQLVKLPAIPAWSKTTIPAFATLLALRVNQPQRFRVVFTSRWPKLFLLLTLVCAIGTTVTNMDPVVWGRKVCEGLKITDINFLFLSDTLGFYLPFVLGCVAIRSESELVDLFAMVIALCLVYSLPILVELRLSPQMNNWIYGFAQHEFGQTVRDGGYRPMVFMAHGLALGLFVAAAALAATTFRKVGLSAFRFDTKWVFPFLVAILVLVKSKGALLFGLVLVPLILFTSPRTQVRAAALMAVLVLAYPWLRTYEVIRREPTVELARSFFGEERSKSLEFRLLNEEVLIERTMQHVYFGWGHYDRADVYPADDTRALTTRDGGWIIVLGERGVTYWVVFFGTLVIPVFAAWRSIDRIRSERARWLVAGLSLMTAMYALDLLPNGLFNTLGVYFAGALYGVLPRLASSRA